GSDEERAALAINQSVLAALGMVRGVTHAEFIRDQADGRFTFLEIAARVGGAGVDKLVEMATGVNPWTEWARLEVAHLRGETYVAPQPRRGYAGLLVSLARQEWPQTGAFDDPEVVWRLEKRHHVGLIVASEERQRVQDLIADYVPRIAQEFTAVEAPLDKPPD
ncbi:MAG: ATPase, partial [Chloroflexi bacterium]